LQWLDHPIQFIEIHTGSFRRKWSKNLHFWRRSASRWFSKDGRTIWQEGAALSAQRAVEMIARRVSTVGVFEHSTDANDNVALKFWEWN